MKHHAVFIVPPAFYRLLLAVAVLCGVKGGGAPAAAADDRPAATEQGEADTLARREQELSRQFRDLEKTFLRLADLLSTSDPRRSAVLRGVFARAREEEVGDRLDTIVLLLEKGQLLKAGTSQANAIEKMRLLLDLLESGDTDRRLANTKEEVKQFIARLSRLITRQRDIEGSTEAGAGEEQLSDRQQTLAEETRGLSEEIGGFARRMDSRQTADGEPGGQKPEPAEGPPGTEKPKKGGNGADEKGEPGGQEPAADGDRSGEGNGEQQQPGEKGGGEAEGQAGGEGSEQQSDAESEGDDEAARARRTKKRLESAEKRMRKAQEQLDQAKRRDARGEQEKAIEELETARAELEEILRQMREQEVERLLVQLEARIRAMLRSERAVLAGTEKLTGAARPSADDAAAEQRSLSERERQLEAARLGREQAAIGNDAAKALTLVRDDGSAVAIPEALEQVRDDSAQAAARLARGDVAGTTRGLLQDLVASLEEMLAALEKAQREQQARQANPSGGRPAEPGEQPLVDKLSELKMIRSLQMRVNTRTKRFAQLLSDDAEQADEPELLEALARLAGRQRTIERAAHDIVTGRTE